MRGTIGYGRLSLGMALAAVALAACSKQGKSDDTKESAPTVVAQPPAPTASPVASLAAAPAADNTDTKTGVKYAAYTGDATKGAVDFLTCKTCHAIEPGVNKIGPSLHAVVGRKAGTIAGFVYSAANKNSGITWTPEKLFQYLEAPQRVVPGTKMTFPGFPDPQKRADVIAYLQSNS